MVLNGVAFRDTRNGLERQTDGLYRHTGRLWVRNTAPGVNYADGNVRLDAPPGYAPRLGFHEEGTTGASLYKKAGTRELWVDEDTNRTYPVAGAPGSVNSVLGTYNTAVDWTVPGSGWLESPIQVTAAMSNVPTRFDFRFAALSLVASGSVYWCVMRNGDPAFSSYQIGYHVFPSANSPTSFCWTYQHSAPGLGSYRFGIGLYADTNIKLTSAMPSFMGITELRA